MVAAIHSTNGRADFAFIGDRKDIWHRMGQQARSDWSAQEWRQAAHMDYTAIKIPAYVPAYVQRPGPGYEPVPNAHFLARNDNGTLLSDKSVTDVYVPHQIADLQETLTQYCEVDPRFTFSTMGALYGGATVFMCAEFSEPQTIGGDAFKAWLLATTSFDSSGASIYNASLTRSVCANTVGAALASAAGTVRVRHNTRFDKERAGKELANILQSVDKFKVVGDAMASVHMAQDAVIAYFKTLLEIPFDAKKDDISTRKLNQYETLFRDYRTTLTETDATAWAAFNAVTRYVDHDRSVRGGDNVDVQRFASAQFGAGASMKSKAYDLLLPLIKDKVAA